ncbi:MAG: hypothetical protein JW982_03585 [Spirochaetes bacterium]|nr:hypothetical protein [Spirochaetota bacterium]
MDKIKKSLMMLMLFSAICIHAQDDMTADGSSDMSVVAADSGSPDGMVSENPESDPGDAEINVNEENSPVMTDDLSGITEDGINNGAGESDILNDNTDTADQAGVAADIINEETSDSASDVTDSVVTDENQDSTGEGDDYYKSIDDDSVITDTPPQAEPRTDLKKVYGRVIYVGASEIVLKYGKKEYYFKYSKDMTGLEICQTAEIYYYIEDKVLIAEKFTVIKESSCYSKK